MKATINHSFSLRLGESYLLLSLYYQDENVELETATGREKIRSKKEIDANGDIKKKKVNDRPVIETEIY